MKAVRWIAALVGLSAGNAAVAAESAPPAREHAVIVHFTYGSTDLTRLFALEKQLEARITESRVGEYDGNEVAVDGSDGFLYMYGPDGDRLFEAIVAVLKSVPFMVGASVRIRYGPPAEGTRERVVTIAP